MGDGKVPRTENYNFTVSQMLPGHSLFEISYVGNRSRDLVTEGTNSDFNNINMVPVGAFFRPNPTTGQIVPIYQANFPTNQYRPLQNYGDIWVVGHGSYSNYNSLQASWQKQSGPITFLTNYTFGKVLGIRDNVSSNGASAGILSIRSTYAPITASSATTTRTFSMRVTFGICLARGTATGLCRGSSMAGNFLASLNGRAARLPAEHGWKPERPIRQRDHQR